RCVKLETKARVASDGSKPPSARALGSRDRGTAASVRRVLAPRPRESHPVAPEKPRARARVAGIRAKIVEPASCDGGSRWHVLMELRGENLTPVPTPASVAGWCRGRGSR